MNLNYFKYCFDETTGKYVASLDDNTPLWLVGALRDNQVNDCLRTEAQQWVFYIASEACNAIERGLLENLDSLECWVKCFELGSRAEHFAIAGWFQSKNDWTSTSKLWDSAESDVYV